jgi:predicted MPP superfamily phosphohydrolase
MAFMLYGFLSWFAADIIIVLQKPFHLLPVESMPGIRLWLFRGITVITLFLIVAGFVNAVTPITQRYDLQIDKSFTGGKQAMKIVAVSDVHLGSIIRKRSMRHLSDMIRKEKPDVLLFLGDLIDGSIGPVLRGDLLSYLSLPEIEYGKYAITGNHEYMSDPGRSIPYIEDKGIRVLKDEVVTLDNGVQLVGRIDRAAMQGFGNGRASLESLLAMADPSKPGMVLDHQTADLARRSGTVADLQLSGHTHDGQIWPLTIVTNKIWELDHGWRKFGNTHVIVSSGFGIWGPRMRIGTRPEIVAINLNGKSQ